MDSHSSQLFRQLGISHAPALQLPFQEVFRLFLYNGGYVRPANLKENRVDRRLSNGELAGRLAGLAMAHPVSRNWKGYWQR